MLKKLITVFFLTGILFRLNAQEISGKVISDSDPEGIPGVNIIIKGSSNGTITDINGDYTIKANSTDTLIFSYIGYLTEEYPVGGLNKIDVIMIPNLEEIGEVVVTALGIKREEKALGYAIQNVKGDEIAKVKEVDVINALSGKVSGVNIIQGSGSIGGGGSRIVIRGETSLAGNNDPIYIINGIRGNANDIASDDIESISVLKGPAAAALYGSEAGGGVVIITSKTGKGSKGIEVAVNSSLTFQSPLVLPKYQNKYGMGSGGAYSYYNGNTNDDPYWDDTYYNWGPEFDGELRRQFTGEKEWVAYPDNVKDFYEVGHTLINNISVSNASQFGDFRFSYTNTDQAGILPNTGLTKNNIGVNTSFNITKGLTLTSNVNYLRTNCANDGKILGDTEYGHDTKEVDVRFTPRNIDIEALKDYWVPGLEGEQQLNYRRSGNNPYFLLYENISAYINNKVIANMALNYSPFEGFNTMGRFGTNYTNKEYSKRHAYSTYQSENADDYNGYYKTGFNSTWDRTVDFLVSYEKELFNGFKAKLSFGGTHYRWEYKILEADAYGMSYLDIYNLNSRDGYIENLDDRIEKYETNSLYAFINFDYKGKVFLDITRRDDWSSRLHPDNNHFNYPSVSLSGLISEIFELSYPISFWKIRGNISQVGKDIPKAYFTIEDKNSFTTHSGLTSLVPSDTRTNPYLKPELTTGYEVGTDIRFFNNRLGLDIAAYYSVTDNQILKAELPESAEWDYYMMNAGKVDSKGLEVTLNATPVKLHDFSWDCQVNWSIDRTYVQEMDSLIDKSVQSVNKHLFIESRPGQQVGTFYGKSYQRSDDGYRLYTESGDTRLTEEVALGNYNPDWMASIYNTLNYKNISLSFLFDWRYGGKLFNEIERKLNMYGLSEATLYNNREGIVPVGKVEEDDGSYRFLTLEDLEEYGKTGGQSGQEYWTTASEEAVPENSLVDATYLKLREVRLSYTIPKSLIDKTFFNSLTIALVGRNLFVWTKVNHVDPEVFDVATESSAYGLRTKVPGYANASVPSVRSIGFTLNCKF